MQIANRILQYGPEGQEKPVHIRLYAPEQERNDWSCRAEIAWPDRTKSLRFHGLDSMQAITLTLQGIGAYLYSTAEHRSGDLFSERRGNGYGFPVPVNARDLLIGDDRRFFGDGV